ncbi:hypothetical protein [Agathobacter rectalis]|uniref:hypothetical protein n=1 Tax=Agathobacter rectalis TaxID=39491 RepID=UPI0027D278EA|nr:hypothetical protein [Agathobacter rectalis]
MLYDFINAFSWKILLGVLVVSSTLLSGGYLMSSFLCVSPNSKCALNALAIDNPMEYARLVLDNEMQAWVD